MSSTPKPSLPEQITQSVVRYIALRRLQQLKRTAADVRRQKKRALRRQRDRQTMFENPHYANTKIADLLQGHEERLRREIRLSFIQFDRLAAWLSDNTTLCDSRFVNLRAKLAIFLYICGHGVSYRNASIHWELNLDRISTFFHEVLTAILHLAKANIIMYKEEERPAVAPCIRNEVGKMFPFFEDCIGAIDGTLVYVSVKGQDRKREGEEGAYRCRKGFLATNVLGCVDFDMNFKLVYPGWEGTAHDVTVFNDARRRGLFVTPRGRFWLADAGYTQADGYGGQILAPYMAVRYHLQEWKKGNQRPQNMKELFNLRHAKLRNVVERTYGVFKNRFRIFQCSRDGFSLRTQNKLIIALSAVHNWINAHGGKPKAEWTKLKRSKRGSRARRRYEAILKQQAMSRANEIQDLGPVHLSRKEGARYMYTKRDKIASDMWEQYQSYLQARGPAGGASEWGSSDESGVSDDSESEDSSESSSCSDDE